MALYQAKIGLEVIETEGIQWTVTRGAPTPLASLEDKLGDVKALYKAKTGHDVDTESDDEIEADGIQWKVTRGAPPSLASLEDKLSDVMALYQAKVGLEVIEAEGIQWTVTRD